MQKSLILIFYFTGLFGFNLNERLDIAGENKVEIKRAINQTPDNQLSGMIWLINHMPEEDLKNLSSKFLLTNCNLAYRVWEESKWGKNIPEHIFFDSVLPYANLNERRDNWRQSFFKKFMPVVNNSASAYEAAAILNQKIFEMLSVIYSTDRPKADQSPFESIDAGMASCTGLSILLIDACRSVGIPARFVGTPMWYNNSGNHSWVEIWDNGWHYTGAAEPTGNKLNEVWFLDLASRATKGDMRYGIFAVTWENSDLYFPMDWLAGIKKYNGVDITDRYTQNLNSEELIPIRIRALDSSGLRRVAKVMVWGENDFTFEGISKDKTCDLNDHLTVMLPRGKTFKVQSGNDVRTINVNSEKIIDLEP